MLRVKVNNDPLPQHVPRFIGLISMSDGFYILCNEFYTTHKNVLTIKFKRKEDEVKSLNFFLINLECLLVPYCRPFAGPYPCAGGGISFQTKTRPGQIMPNNVF